MTAESVACCWQALDRYMPAARDDTVAGIVSALIDRSGASTGEGVANVLGASVKYSTLRAAEGGMDAMVMPGLRGTTWVIIVDPMHGHEPSIDYRIGHEIAHILTGIERASIAARNWRDPTARVRIEAFCDEFGAEFERQLVARAGGLS